MIQLNGNVIVIENVYKSFGDTKAVENVNLKISAGSSLVICGPSGCGKTTLLRLIAGLEVPDKGIIHINGIKASTPEAVLSPHKRGIGFVFQTSSLWPHMNIRDNICFGLEGMSKKEKEVRLEELIDAMELWGMEKRYPHQISGGQARRAALARALAPQPSILLMDEPLTNLDAELKRKLIVYIKDRIARWGSVLLYVTHDENEVSDISDKIIHMRGGSIEVH